jgi:DNA-binding MarR family transcriptional regulator
MKNTEALSKRHQEFHRVLEEWGVESSRGIELMRMLMGSARMLEVLADHDLQDVGLSLPRLRLLLWLGVDEQRGNKAGISPSALSHYQHISKNTVSSLLASLEEQGLVERTLSREDKRSFNIRLTKAGRDLVRSAIPQHGKYISEAFAELSAEEQKALLKLLQKLRQSLVKQVSKFEFHSYKTSL